METESKKLGRPKGLPKTGGRQAGTPNRTTSQIREVLQSLFEENVEVLRQDIKNLEPKERVRVMLELGRFVLPTLKSVDHTTNGASVRREVTINLKQG